MEDKMTTNENVSEGAKKTYDLLQQTTNLHIEYWTQHVFLSWLWWLAVILTIVPWILWWKFRKKESTHRLLFAGFFSIFVAIWLDNIGTQLGFWYYKYEVIPFTPSFKPWDISLMPVLTMFFLQINPKANVYIKGLIYSGIISFIAEPFFMWIGYFEYPHWNYIYSFAIYFFIYLIAHFVVTRNKFEKLIV
jgi:hypothetical protein